MRKNLEIYITLYITHVISLYFCGSLWLFTWILSPDVAHLRSVVDLPAVGSLVPPAHVAGVLPQQLHLPSGVTCVPQGVTQVLPRPCARLHSL